MNEQLERILEQPKSTRVGILLASVLTVLVGYYLAFYKNIGQQITEHDEAIEKLNVEIREKTAIAKNLPKFEKEVERLDAELAKALEQLPDKKEIAQLLGRVSDKARDAGLDIRLFQPKPEQLKDFYAEVPVDIEVVGGYHQVAAFFDEVGHLERVVNMDQFRLFEPKTEESDVLIRTAVVATSFRFLEESERPKQDEKDKKKRRKRKSGEEE